MLKKTSKEMQMFSANRAKKYDGFQYVSQRLFEYQVGVPSIIPFKNLVKFNPITWVSPRYRPSIILSKHPETATVSGFHGV